MISTEQVGLARRGDAQAQTRYNQIQMEIYSEIDTKIETTP